MGKVKPFLTIDEQINLLKSRGLIIKDIDEARNALEYHNYYRLSGYSLTLRKNDKFYEGVAFSDLLQIYNFDNELKSIILDALAEIEINLKTHIGYVLGELTDPLGYMDAKYYESNGKYEKFKNEFEEALSDNKHEVFVKHHIDEHDSEFPIWVAVEVLSFGSVSKFFKSLRQDLKKTICIQYYHAIKPYYLWVWFHSISVLRNICAHRARLFNRGLTTAIPFPAKEFNKLKKYGYDPDGIGKKLFFAIIIIDRILPNRGTSDKMIKQITALAKKYPFVDLGHYGFKKNWKKILFDINEKYY